ncbi:MAG: polysaccharide pyruvyl transferase family protein [Alphaproteobacteria bacterium]|nr:polysaccharide pyruvyl transferase family protein [Alphaproteobacteria bacterium]
MSLLDRVRERLQPAVDGLAKVADADVALQLSMAALIERARDTYPAQPWHRWRPGEPLKLLFAGYSGTRNTGADVRVEEMIRQFRHVLGQDQLDLTILVFDPALTRGYFRTAKQVRMPTVFPRFLYDVVAEQHGVVACEGSMFKSKFASALTTFMVGALGLANAGDKLSIAYGGEAGAMSTSLQELVRRYVADSFVITRNVQSGEVLGALGVKTRLGTDTAWTFDPGPDAQGRALLTAAGWDGVTPVLAVCPINPFWWPVRPSVGKAVARWVTGAFDDEHYDSIYFHHAGEAVQARQEAYLDGLARGIEAFRRDHDVFVVCVGMEQLDRRACEPLAARLGGAPVFVSDEVEMYELVSLLRQCTYMVSSRYHGIVTCMPAGVLSVGVTMDERIRNLMVDRGTPELALEVDDPQLARKVDAALRHVADHADTVREGIERTVVRNLEVMGQMGTQLARYVRDRMPGFPLPPGMGEAGDPWSHLPPLSPSLSQLVARHRSPP